MTSVAEAVNGYLVYGYYPASMNDSGDTAFLLMSSAQVLIMTPGLALFYGGMVSNSNVLHTLMMSMVTLCLVTVQWLLFGYSFAFGPGTQGFGNCAFCGGEGIGEEAYGPYSEASPHMAFWVFQLTFAMITPAIISGAVVGRIRFEAWIIFTLLWSTVVYSAVAHWVWSAWLDSEGVLQLGWFRDMGALDFAGGTVVHLASGTSALAAALVLGSPKRKEEAHNVPMVFIGASLLWFGWLGFNGGSAILANGLAALAYVNTNVATATGFLTWVCLESFIHKPTVVGGLSGAVVGLVGITPAAGFIRPVSAIAVGIITPMICFLSIRFLKRGVADTLDVFFCHGIGGFVGCLLTGCFAEAHWNSAGLDGAFFNSSTAKGGGLHLLGIQLATCLMVAVFSFTFTFVTLHAMQLVMQVRPSESEEKSGLDIAHHGSPAYLYEDNNVIEITDRRSSLIDQLPTGNSL